MESFNSKLRDEFIDGETFYPVNEFRVLAKRWRIHYNTVRPHSELGYDHQHRRRGWPQQARGVEKWKPLRAPTLHTPDDGWSSTSHGII